MFNIGYAADQQQRTYNPVMTEALQKLLPDYQRHPDIVHFLVRKKQADPSALLRQATKKDDWKTMSLVLDNGAAVDGIDETTQRTALQLAQSKQAAELLLARGARADILTPDGKTVVQLAIEELKPFALLHVLCQQESIDMNHKEPTNGNTASHMLFLSKTVPSDMTNRSTLLRLAGADFTTPNKHGQTAQSLLKTCCSRSQAHRIKADWKLVKSFYAQSLRKMLPEPLVCITRRYADILPFGKTSWASFQKHKQRTRTARR